MSEQHTLKVSRYKVNIPQWEKVLFPEKNLKKKDIIEYYDNLTEYILPFLTNNVLTLQRFPDGINHDGFYQKEYQKHYPNFLKSHTVNLVQGGKQQQVVCRKKADLLYLVGQGTIAFHTWLSKVSNLKKPSRLLFDLDPPEHDINIKHLVEASRAIKKILDDLSLPSFVMTTGSKGLHVVSPIKASHSFDVVREFAKNIAQSIADDHSDKFTTEIRKEKRHGRVFLDYTRNAYGQTSVAPYSLRALSKAPIATPLSWSELSKLKSSQDYTIDNILQRLSKVMTHGMISIKTPRH